MKRVRLAFQFIAHEEPAARRLLVPLIRLGGKWKTLPKGWDSSSVEKFWITLTGDKKHKVTECIKRMDDKIDDPGSFCASLADKVLGPEWRKRKKKSSIDRIGKPKDVNRVYSQVAKILNDLNVSVQKDSVQSRFTVGHGLRISGDIHDLKIAKKILRSNNLSLNINFRLDSHGDKYLHVYYTENADV